MPNAHAELIELGVVRDVNGERATCCFDLSALVGSRQQEANGLVKAASVGGYVKIGVGRTWVFGSIAQLETDRADRTSIIAVIDFLGEGQRTAQDHLDEFRKGVSLYPHPDDKVYLATGADLNRIFSPDSQAHIEVGTIYPTSDIRASLLYDRLLSRHFAVLGSTGTGKSTLVALMLHKISAAAPHGHIVILDPHGEYGAAFGSTVKVYNVDNLQIPYWAMNLEEHCEAFIPDNEETRAVAINVLAKCLVAARAKSTIASNMRNLTADSPVPYLLGDLLEELDSETGKLEKQADFQTFTRLKLNIIQKFSDRRFRFIFDAEYLHHSLEDFVKEIIRIPSQEHPISIIDMSGTPSEMMGVIVSMISRLVFDYAVWTPSDIRSPVLLICEEAQRYLPAERLEFAASAERQLERIAREGRKYGVALCLISQRPAELSPTALSQCGTIVAFRLSNSLDQTQVRAALPEASGGMVDAIASLQSRECIICGEGTRVPVRVRIDELERHSRPASEDPVFSVLWNTERQSEAQVAEVIRRWRGESPAHAPRKS